MTVIAPANVAAVVIPPEAGIQDFSIFWTSAFAGVTKWADTILLELWIRSWLFLSTPVATATHGRTPGSRPGKAGSLPLFWLTTLGNNWMTLPTPFC